MQRLPSLAKQATRSDAGTLRPRVKPSFRTAPKRGTRTRGCYVELPRKLWDRIVLLVFTCCLFTFLRAFLGFGLIDQDSRALSGSSVLPPATLSVPSLPNRSSAAQNEGREMRAQGVARVMVDWHGSYELLPSAASIPQDAFPDPTPAPVEAGQGRALDEESFTATTKARTPVDTPPALYGAPYDPFRLAFGDSVEGEVRGLYPVAELPSTAPKGGRTRRFGRCLAGEACL